MVGQVTSRGSVASFTVEPRDGSGAAWSIYNPTGDDFRIFGASADRLILDNSGNLGLGVTPSAWGSGYKAFELSTRGANITGDVNFNYTYVGANNFHDGSSWKYKVNGYSTRYAQGDGVHYWYNAASGTAGNTITFTQAMILDSSG